MQDTPWKFSNEEPVDEFIQPEEGPQYIQITKAEVSADELHYILRFKSLMNDASLSLRYFLFATNEDGELIPDSKQRRTLVSLKRAIYGPDAVGLPNPVDIVGSVVEADVKLSKPNDKGYVYPRIYNYKPAPQSIVEAFGLEGQYCIPDDGEGPEE